MSGMLLHRKVFPTRRTPESHTIDLRDQADSNNLSQ